MTARNRSGAEAGPEMPVDWLPSLKAVRGGGTGRGYRRTDCPNVPRGSPLILISSQPIYVIHMLEWTSTNGADVSRRLVLPNASITLPDGTGRLSASAQMQAAGTVAVTNRLFKTDGRWESSHRSESQSMLKGSPVPGLRNIYLT